MKAWQKNTTMADRQNDTVWQDEGTDRWTGGWQKGYLGRMTRDEDGKDTGDKVRISEQKVCI